MYFLLRQQQGRLCLVHLDHLSPTRRSAVALPRSSSTCSNRTHLPQTQPPAARCLNRPPLQPFLPFFFLKKSRYAKKSQKISLIFYIIYAKKRRPINCTERHKLKVASLEVHYLRFSLTNSPPLFCIAKTISEKKKNNTQTHTYTRVRVHQYPNRKPVYAKQVCMHNLWIIYFCICVQVIGEQTRR